MRKFYMSSATWAALGAAILFGGSTPFAKQLVGEISPIKKRFVARKAHF